MRPLPLGRLQSLTGDGAVAGGSARGRAVNNGTINVKSKADAAGVVEALATSSAIGIKQFLDKAETVRARAVNNNKIVAHAVGLASATVGSANATYVRAVGISQNLDADLYDGSWQDGLLAKAFARNNGTITAFSKASAHATYGTAAANASAAGISQYVHGGSRLSSAFARNTGDILVTAKPMRASMWAPMRARTLRRPASTSRSTEAAATCPARSRRRWRRTAATSRWRQSPRPAAPMSATLRPACNIPSGLCDQGAVARASAAGISQDVYDAQTARALATNSGNINVLAKATAQVHGGTYATAIALGAGVYQSRGREHIVGGLAVEGKIQQYRHPQCVEHGEHPFRQERGNCFCRGPGGRRLPGGHKTRRRRGRGS